MARKKKPALPKETLEKPDPALTHDAVRRVNRDFIRALPTAAADSGVFTVPQHQLAAAELLPVPDGRYRVIGHDWIHAFKGRKWISSHKARPDQDPAGIVDVA